MHPVKDPELSWPDERHVEFPGGEDLLPTEDRRGEHVLDGIWCLLAEQEVMVASGELSADDDEEEPDRDGGDALRGQGRIATARLEF